MGMSTHIIGFVPPDDKWRAMKAVWDSCKEVGISPPEAVWKFFNDEEPDETGVEVRNLPLREWRDDSREGYEITIADIPANVKVLRLYNSW